MLTTSLLYHLRVVRRRVLPGCALVGALLSGAGAAHATLLGDLTPDTLREHALIKSLRDEAATWEHGDGVPTDGARAAKLYCEAARLGDVTSQYNLGWMYTNGRGLERNDSVAAFFFNAAAEQGDVQAQRMLRTVGGPTTEVPDCMRDPEPSPSTAPPQTAKKSAPVNKDWSQITGEIPPNAPRALVDLVKVLAPEYKLRPELVLAVMEAESGFNTVALSPRNAKGLMQLIPETAARFNVRNAYDPAQNIRGGMAYLRWLLAYFEGDVKLALAAYNAGEGAVDRYRGVPPYLETRAYVLKILARFGNWTHPFDTAVTAPSAELRRMRERRR